MRYLIIFLLLFGVAHAQGVGNSESSVIKLDQVKFNSKIKARYLTCQVGDSTVAVYEPSLNITAWGDECRFSIDLGSDPSCDLSGVNPLTGLANGSDEITLAGTHVSYKIYRRRDGNLEWEIVLSAVPDTNVFTYDIETEGLDFWYQPELTKDEVGRGYERPDSVVGSYAVYHLTKSNNMRRIIGKDTTYWDYKTGKAFHIYRPLAIDANHDSAWCDLDIDTKTRELTITVRQGYLDGAAYPVSIDPTIGYTTEGSSNSPYMECDIRANFDLGDSPEYDAVLDSGYFYGYNWMTQYYAADSTAIVSVMCYRKLAGFSCTSPTVMLTDYSTDIEVTNYSPPVWSASPMSGKSNVYADSAYIVAFQATMRVDSLMALQALRIYSDDNALTNRKVIDSSNTTGCGTNSLFAPNDLTGCETITYKYSIYVTYVAESEAVGQIILIQ